MKLLGDNAIGVSDPRVTLPKLQDTAAATAAAKTVRPFAETITVSHPKIAGSVPLIALTDMDVGGLKQAFSASIMPVAEFAANRKTRECLTLFAGFENESSEKPVPVLNSRAA